MTTRMASLSAIAAAAALAACASTSTTAPAKPVAAQPIAGCVDSGSRIPQPACVGVGRAYSHDDLARTGQTTLGDALALLDPTIRVNH